jgi:hypothetical protein
MSTADLLLAATAAVRPLRVISERVARQGRDAAADGRPHSGLVAARHPGASAARRVP